MYESLPAQLSEIKKSFEEYAIESSFELGQPASPQEILDCESILGFVLPSSYREFLLHYNGASFLAESETDGIYIKFYDISTALKQTLEEKRSHLELGHKWYPIVIIATNDDIIFALDSTQSENGEYKVIDCFHEDDPDEWRIRPILNSFDALIHLYSSLSVYEDLKTE